MARILCLGFNNYMPVNLNNMKSLLEIVTILVLLFCVTMLEKMDKDCYPDGPSPYHQNSKQKKMVSTPNFAGLVIGGGRACSKTAK